jgi:phenylacetate-CoA ligase
VVCRVVAIEDSIRSLQDVGDEFKIEISRVRNMDRIKISVEPNSPVPKASYAEMEARIARGLKGSLGVDVEVEVLAYGSLPRTEGKARRLVDLRESVS